MTPPVPPQPSPRRPRPPPPSPLTLRLPHCGLLLPAGMAEEGIRPEKGPQLDQHEVRRGMLTHRKTRGYQGRDIVEQYLRFYRAILRSLHTSGRSRQRDELTDLPPDWCHSVWMLRSPGIELEHRTHSASLPVRHPWPECAALDSAPMLPPYVRSSGHQLRQVRCHQLRLGIPHPFASGSGQYLMI